MYLLLFAAIVVFLVYWYYPRPFANSEVISVRGRLEMYNNGNPYDMLLLEKTPSCSEEEFTKEMHRENYIFPDRDDVRTIARQRLLLPPTNFAFISKRNGVVFRIPHDTPTFEEFVGKLPVKEQDVLYLAKPIEHQAHFSPIKSAA